MELVKNSTPSAKLIIYQPVPVLPAIKGINCLVEIVFWEIRIRMSTLTAKLLVNKINKFA